MHSRPQVRHTERIWRISLEQIEAAVSEFLGPGRVRGNGRQSTFSRHVSMYLARHVGRWSYSKISHFYNRRHNTTVIAAIHKIERLRKADESVDALLETLTSALGPETALHQTEASRSKWRQLVVDAISKRICNDTTEPVNRTSAVHEGLAVTLVEIGH